MIKYRTVIGDQATDDEVDTFVELVASGGAVQEQFVRDGATREGAQLVFAEDAGQTVGVAALKRPSDHYRSGLQSPQKAGFLLTEDEYPYELGYVSVSPEHLGRGIATELINHVMRLADGYGIFATTSHPAMKCHLLPRFKFVPAGTSWKNASGDVLVLLVHRSS